MSPIQTGKCCFRKQSLFAPRIVRNPQTHCVGKIQGSLYDDLQQVACIYSNRRALFTYWGRILRIWSFWRKIKCRMTLCKHS